jgi:hypothetical protein
MQPKGVRNMNSTHRNSRYLFAALVAMSLSAQATDQGTNKPPVVEHAPDCAWGDATFDDACADYSAKMAAKAARYVAERSPKNIVAKSANGISQKAPNSQDIVHK